MGKRIARVKAGTSKEAATNRKQKAVEAFIMNGGNKTQAAITAGYAAHSAHTAGNRLFKDGEVLAAVSKRRAELMTVDSITAERIKLQLGRIALADIRKLHDENGELLPMGEWDDDSAAAAAGVKVDGRTGQRELRMHDPVGALDKLARIHGMYEKDNQQRRDDLSIQIAIVPAKKE